MLALRAPQELGFWLIASPCLDKPVIRCRVLALWTVNISLRHGLLILRHHVNLIIFPRHSLFYNSILDVLGIKTAGTVQHFLVLIFLGFQNRATLRAKHHLSRGVFKVGL